MASGEKTLDDTCPHCDGKLTSWWFSDHYSYGSGISCENESKNNCSLTLAWADWREKQKEE